MGRKHAAVSYEVRYRPLTQKELVKKEETAEQTTISFNEEEKLVTVDFKTNPEVEPQDWDPSTFVIVSVWMVKLLCRLSWRSE